MHRAKIVATVGPRSSDTKTIQALLKAGVNVFRLNFSHGTHQEHAERIRMIRQCAETQAIPIGILVDIQGPKIRTGDFKKENIPLKKGARVRLTSKNITGDAHCIPIHYGSFEAVVKKGMTILFGDGEITMRVYQKKGKNVFARVLSGGMLGEHKGVHMLGVKLPGVFSKKDFNDITFALRHGADYCALSFVSSRKEVLSVKRFLARKKKQIPLIAKIERPEAVAHLEDILTEVDGVMVARGDLGIEGRLEEVPIWQKKIIAEGNRRGKIVITATQMLESMMVHPSPTRAEVTDIANAVFDGTDAVMLSGETAVGAYPVRSVQQMRAIVETAERSNFSHYYVSTFDDVDDSSTCAVAHAAIDAAYEARADAIVVFTLSGVTARIISKRRPAMPLFALTPDARVYNAMSLLWGVTPLMTTQGKHSDDVVKKGLAVIQRKTRLKKGSRVVMVFGGTTITGGTDRMRLVHV